MSAHKNHVFVVCSALLSALVISCGGQNKGDTPLANESVSGENGQQVSPSPGTSETGGVPDSGAIGTSTPTATSAPGPSDLPAESGTSEEASADESGAGSTTRSAPTKKSKAGRPPSPKRPGVPYDIPVFENKDGDLTNFRQAVQDRCPGGTGPSCLVVEEQITGDESNPDDCTIDDILYDTSPQPPQAPDEKAKLKRGTTVTAVVSCPPESESPGSDTPSG
jgi:hypothetical protein